MKPWVSIVVVLASLALLLVACRHAGRRFSLSAELNRKMVHMGMGLICTLFPLFFDQFWPVFFLAISSVVALFAVRSFTFLRSSVGASLHGVERTSLGEIFFPIAVAAVWYISFDEPLYFSLSILVLTLADAFAALVGSAYGKQVYTTKEGYKTWEGSFIFFIATFLCVHIPLLLMTETGRAECLLIALLIGILVMIIEAVSWRGLDNLFIPLCVCTFLNVYDSYSVSQILLRIVFVLSIMVLLFSVRSRAKLDDASMLGASLITYLVITMGGWQWGVAPVILFVNYLFLGPSKTTKSERIHTVYALLAVNAAAFFWLLLYFKQGRQDYFFYYNLAYMAELVCIFIAQWAHDYPEKSLVRVNIKAGAVAFFMIMVPYMLVSPGRAWFMEASVSFFMALVSALIFCLLQPQVRYCQQNKRRYLGQGVIGFIASGMSWLILALLREIIV